LAEAWRGGSRQAVLARFLALCDVEDLTERQAHDVVVDVAVVEGAIRRRDAVVTSNPTHTRAIADAVRARLRIESI
jgi:hypothetical protein